MSNGRASRLVIMMLAVALACPALSWARALEPARESAWRARAWSGAARRAGEAHEVIAMHGTALVFGPGKLLKQLARALGRQHTRPAPRRNAQPPGRQGQSRSHPHRDPRRGQRERHGARVG